MTGRVAASVAALVGIAGCISYSGGARAVDPAGITSQDGWVVAGATPALRQSGAHDCGAASLAMVAGRWDIALSVSEAVTSLPAPTATGTSLGALRDAAQGLGLTAFAIAGDRATLVHELQAGRPVIIGLLLPFGPRHAQTHYEVVVAVHATDDQFVTIDPASGWRSRSWADLDGEWAPVGRPTLVVLGPLAWYKQP